MLPPSAVGADNSGQPTGGGLGKWGWIVPIIGSVIGGILDKASNDATNKANAQNVDKQIAFQREQNATQYQRAVADISAAGLNPALAYKQGGNTSGSGAAATAGRMTYAERLAASVQAYNEFANGTAQRQLLREQAGATYANARKAILEGNILAPDSNLATNAEYQSEYQGAKLAETRGRKYTADRIPQRFKLDLAATQQGINSARAYEAEARTRATLNEQQFQNAWFRKNIAPYINSTAKALEGIDAVTRTAKGLSGYTPTTRYY